MKPCMLEKDTSPVTESFRKVLLGSLVTKAGYNGVDLNQATEFFHQSAKGSVYFDYQVGKDNDLVEKARVFAAKKQSLEATDLSSELRHADDLIAQLEKNRDLSQTIVHIDCDCFHASVELLDHPELEQVPFAVGDVVLQACNYVARSKGCRAGMLSSAAKKFCTELTIVKPNPEKYKEKTRQTRGVMARFDPRFESCGEDEAHLNLTRYCAENGLTPTMATEKLRREIRETTGLAVAAGIAANTQLAKICANINKPNGQFQLASEPSEIKTFMESLPTRKTVGIGRVTEQLLASIGVDTCGDIFAQRQLLRPLLGDKMCTFLLQVYLGLGKTKLQPSQERPPKSFSIERTFPETSGLTNVSNRLLRIAKELSQVLESHGCKGRTLTLKIRLWNFSTIDRQTSVPFPIRRPDELHRAAMPLLRRFLHSNPAKVRLLGLRCTKLVHDKALKMPFTFTNWKLGAKFEDSADAESRQPATNDEAYAHAHSSPTATEPVVHWSPLDKQGNPTVCTASSSTTHGKQSDSDPRVLYCPVCNSVQAADNASLNAHLDLCLSWPAISEALEDDRL